MMKMEWMPSSGVFEKDLKRGRHLSISGQKKVAIHAKVFKTRPLQTFNECNHMHREHFRFGVSVGFWSIFRFLKGGGGEQRSDDDDVIGWVLSIILTYWLDVVVYNGSSKGHSLSVQGKVRDKKLTSHPIFSRLRSILFIQIISSSLSGLILLSSPIRRCHHIDIMRECSLESGHHILENKR